MLLVAGKVAIAAGAIRILRAAQRGTAIQVVDVGNGDRAASIAVIQAHFFGVRAGGFGWTRVAGRRRTATRPEQRQRNFSNEQLFFLTMITVILMK